MRVFALHCGGDLQDVGIFDPEHPQAGEALYNPYYMYVIEHPRGNVLLDTGAHPTLRTDPRSRLGDMADVFEALLGEDDTVPGCLSRIGLRPEDIAIVVQSHLHFDHAGGLEHLGHAPVFVQQAELDFAFDRTHDQAEIYLVDGYRSRRALPDDHLAELPTFVMARRLATLGWVLTHADTEHARRLRAWRIATFPDATRRYLASS
jgi:glyoxylase-like metal-dependent hydrolase (beta-lactamase superfamily II)